MKLAFQNELEGKIRFRVVEAEGITVRSEAPGLWEKIEALSAEYRSRFAGFMPGAIPEIGPARKLYRDCGVDPTRRRPASEALLRRILKGKPLYRINNAVDVCNYCSLVTFLPIGMYDLDSVRGNAVTIRTGRDDETYRGLGKDTVTLHGQIVLADEDGPFGHPSGDSFRTRVTDATTRLLWILMAPGDFDAPRLEEYASMSGDWIEKTCMQK